MNCIACVLIQGHQVASGLGGDRRFPRGTIAEQLPHFYQLGLDLSPYYLGTLNLSIAPYHYHIQQATYSFQNVRWSAIAPPEDFSFFACQLTPMRDLTSEVSTDPISANSVSADWVRTDQVSAEQVSYHGLIYYPHPETKPEHFQPPDILEVLAPKIAGVQYGDRFQLTVDRQLIKFI